MLNQFILIVIEAFICICGFTFLELLHRKKQFSPELLRRIAHVFSSMIVIFFSFFLFPTYFIGTLCFFFLVIVLSRWKGIFNHIHKVKRVTFGEEFLALGFIFS